MRGIFHWALGLRQSFEGVENLRGFDVGAPILLAPLLIRAAQGGFHFQEYSKSGIVKKAVSKADRVNSISLKT